MREQVLLKEHSIIKSGVRILRPSEYKELRASVQKRGKQVLMDCLLLSGMRYEEVLRLRHNPDSSSYGDIASSQFQEERDEED